METPKKEKNRKAKSRKKSKTPQTPSSDPMAAKATTTPAKEAVNKKKSKDKKKAKGKKMKKSTSLDIKKPAEKNLSFAASAPTLPTFQTPSPKQPLSSGKPNSTSRMDVMDGGEYSNSPSVLFKQHIKREADSGNAIVNAEYHHGDRKVFFADGSNIQLLKTGHFVRLFPDGKTLQCDPDGKITPAPLSAKKKNRSRRTSLEGDEVPESPDDLFKHQIKREAEAGNIILKADYKAGDREVTFADGSKMQLLKTGHFLRNYATGATLQCNPDGKLIKVCLILRAHASCIPTLETCFLCVLTLSLSLYTRLTWMELAPKCLQMATRSLPLGVRSTRHFPQDNRYSPIRTEHENKSMLMAV